MNYRLKLLSTIFSLIVCIGLLKAQNHTFIALDNAGNLYEVNTDSCKSTKLTICTNFKGKALSIAMDGTTLYIVDNQGYLYSNTLGATGTTTTCKNLGQFKSKSTAIYGMTVGPGGIVYAASGSLIETYNIASATFGTLGSLPTKWTIGGDLLFYKGILYEAVQINLVATNDALIQVNLANPAASTLYLNFIPGTKVFGFASVTVPCSNNQAFALSDTGTNTDIFAVDMINKVQSKTPTCTLPYKVNDAASVAETQSATPPVAPTVVSPLNFCQNDPVTSLTATVASNMDTLKWYTVYTGGTATGKPVPVLSSATVGTIKYYVSDFDTSTKCESTRDSIIVNINPYPAVPTINPVGPDTICNGSPLLLTSTALATNINQWYLNNTVIAGATNITYSASAAGNYTIKTSTAAGCSKTSIPSIVALTQATIAYPGSPFCPVGTKAVTQTGDTGGRYTVTPVGLVIDSINGTINLGTSKSGTYTVTYTVGPAHCPFTTSVTVQPQTAGISYSKPTYCKSDPNQNVIFAPGSLTTGTFTSSPVGLSINATGTINPSASTVGSYQIKYSYGTAGVGCGVMTATDSVSITDVPVVPAISGLNKLCTGSSITLVDTLAGGVWSSSNTSLATVISNTGVVTAVAQGNVTIIYTVTNACGSSTQSQPLTITNGPVTPPITGANNVCITKTITLSNSNAGGTWTTSDNSIATVSNTGVVTGVAAGNVTITYSVANTCGVAAQTQPVKVNAPTISNTPISICPTALPYTWNGNSYASAGTYTVHLTNAVGCDSAATLVLSLKSPTSSNTSVSVCPVSLPYTWNGNTYAAAGTYTIHLTNAVGCDSAATLVLSLKANTASTTTVSVCQSALPYTWNGNSYPTPGSYTIHLTNAAGCDSAATLVLSLNSVSSSTTTLSICPSALPYLWNGNSYPSAGTYIVHLTNTLGCDSAATLVLSLNNVSASNTTISICSTSLPYTWNGNSYPTLGTYTVHLTNALGCDSAATLVLSLKSTSVSSTPVSICPSSLPYSWNGNSYATAGTYTVHLTNALGCDSAATLVLSLKQTSVSSTPISICPTALPYSWNGNSYATAGTYTIHLTNSVGCDSVATLVLTIKLPTSSTTPVSICPSALPYSWNGNNYVAAGTYTIHLTNAVGCDSATTLVLSVNANTSSTTPVTVCKSALPYSWNGNIYATAGTYIVHLTNSSGCDSAATLVLTVNLPTVSSTAVSVCPSSLPFSWNGNSYSTAGTYTVHLTNALGCDSAATLVLSLKSTSVSSTPVSICPASLPYSWNGNSYATAGTYTVHLTNALGCDSAATLVLSLKQTSVSSTPINICPTALPYSWNGNSYATTGTYTIHLTNSVGCDSAASLVLSLLPTSSSTSTVSICPSSLPFTWNGNSYPTAGNYTVHFTNSVGCDSAATLILSLKPNTTSTTNISICPSALPYSWNGNSFAIAGTYTIHLTNSVGCDSAATLVLSVKSTSVSSTPISICPNALPFTWNGNSYATVGTYTVHLTNSVGCDSAATLILSLLPTSVSTTPISICPNALPYTWNGNSYSAAGTYVVHLKNSVGCDSAATLILTLKALPVVSPVTGGNFLCANNTLQLSEVTTGGIWSSNSPSVATVDNSGLVQGISAGNVVISYALTNTCGTTTQTMNVTVNAAPVVNKILGNNNMCVNTNSQLSESTTGGTWSSSNTTAIVVDNTGLMNAVGGGNSVITYSVTNKCGTASQSINIVVGLAPIVSPIFGNDSVCVNANLQLTDTTPAGLWTSGTPSATVNANGVVVGTKTGYAVIYYTVTNVCGTTLQKFNVYINDVPQVADIVGTSNICLNTTTQLTDITPNGTWSSNYSNILPVSSTGLVTGDSVGTATISYAVKNTCGTTTKTFGVTITAAPTSLPIRGKDSLCTATTVKLTDANSGGSWTSSNPLVAAVDNNGNVLGVSAGTSIITYTVSNFCGAAVANYPVLIHPVPSSSFYTDPLLPNVCIGTPITFEDNTTTNPVVTSIWYFGNGVTDTGNIVTYTYPTANNYFVTHRIIDQFGCISTPSKIPVIVQALPTVNAGYTMYVLKNDSITFSPQVTGLDNHSSVVWTPNIFFTNNNNTILNPVCTPMHDTTYTITVADSIGCKGKDTLHVVVLEIADIPNVFSPNGDGTHETWIIPHLDKFPGIKLRVFDRNGQVVYYCNDKYVPWNGKYGGKDVPFGVYYYILDRGFHLPLLSGSITIIR